MRLRISWLFFYLITTVTATGQSLLEDAPRIGERYTSYQQSSYDRTGYNVDYFQYARFGSLQGNINFIETVKSGRVNNPGGTTNGKNEYVICKIQGPAVLDRIWLISLFSGAYDVKLKFYFDGETTPRLSTTDRALFAGGLSPFLPPLAYNFQQTCGGSLSYLPMNINESLIVTVDSARIYYQFGYTQLSPDTVLTSWTGEEDHSYLVNELAKTGIYPKTNLAVVQKDTTTLSLLAGQTMTLFAGNDEGSIEGIQLRIPGLDMSNAYPVADSGRYHKGKSKFRLTINPSSSKYTLVKRMSKMTLYGTFVNEKAQVKIDGVNAGTWSNTGYRDHHFFEEVSFVIPPALCSGKSAVNVEISYVNDDEWNEFYYWILCDDIATDSVDVGNITSETAHNYSVSQSYVNPFTLNFHRTRYLTPTGIKQMNRRILDSVFIRITFDDELLSVYCPIGLFFGTGTHDAAEMKAVPAGMTNGVYYNYLTMPYWKNALVELENKSSLPLPGINSYIFSSSEAGDKQTTGYLVTQYSKALLSATDTTTDYHVANVSGKGVLLGHVIEAEWVGDSTIYNWLEGDERIYIDDARSPIVHGTGTEDLYNATFYFVLDEFSLPQHGMTNSDRFAHRSMYRFYLTDPLYFSKNLTFHIEHGDYNNRPADYHSLCFFYLQPDDSGYVLTDSIDVGDAVSESLHAFAPLANSTPVDLSSSFEGEHFRDSISLTGRKLDAGSSFRVQIRPDNDGVRLLRTLYFAEKNQVAKVYADDVLVGYWFTPGNNPYISWKDNFFYIPGQYTAGRSTLQIRLENQSAGGYWTEMDYSVYTYILPDEVLGISDDKKEGVLEVYPNPTNGRFRLNMDKSIGSVARIEILDMLGVRLLEQHVDAGNDIDIGHLPNATYLCKIYYGDGLSEASQVVLQKD